MVRLLTPRNALAILATVALIPMTTAAAAQPPGNDDRADATAITALPAALEGTTVGATTEITEPALSCAGTQATVWYALTAPAKGRIVVRLTANDPLDAALDVFHRTRSQITPMGCQPTDSQGAADLVLNTEAKGQYLIRVTQRTGSEPGSFKLEALIPAPAPQPPGALLAGCRRRAKGRPACQRV